MNRTLVVLIAVIALFGDGADSGYPRKCWKDLRNSSDNKRLAEKARVKAVDDAYRRDLDAALREWNRAEEALPADLPDHGETEEAVADVSNEAVAADVDAARSEERNKYAVVGGIAALGIIMLLAFVFFVKKWIVKYG